MSTRPRVVRNSNGSAKKVFATLPPIEHRNPIGRIAFTRDRSEIEEVAALLGFSTSERPGVVGEQVWIEMAKKLKVID